MSHYVVIRTDLDAGEFKAQLEADAVNVSGDVLGHGNVRQALIAILHELPLVEFQDVRMSLLPAILRRRSDKENWVSNLPPEGK